MFSVPGVKGVLFGAGTDFAKMRGSASNDAFRIKDGKVCTLTNNNGGVNGGITNGSPVLFTTVIKPTPSIYKQQETIDFVSAEENGENLTVHFTLTDLVNGTTNHSLTVKLLEDGGYQYLSYLAE
jgi:chorismate synthase